MCAGPGHMVVYANPAMKRRFGEGCLGLPAREALLDLPSTAFELLDATLRRGKPLARWVRYEGEDWRMTVAPRIDPSGEVYGVSFRLRARSGEEA
jgi:hypothetical protein